MGLFDFLGGKKADSSADKAKTKKSDKEIARLSRIAGEKLAQNYDRQEAIAELGRIGTAAAAAGLLRRFDFSMEPSITDQEEKEAAAEGVAAIGQDALPAIRTYCTKAESLTWPLKILRRIVPEEEIVDELLSVLDQFDTEYTRNPEPKIQLIALLAEYAEDDVRIAVEPYLTDVNESVRFHAVDTVLAMDSAESLEALLEALAEEESLRVKNRIAGGVAAKEWEVPADVQDACAQALPEQFSLNAGRIQRVG